MATVYKGKYPTRIESVWGEPTGDYHYYTDYRGHEKKTERKQYYARTNDGKIYKVNVVRGKLPPLGMDIHDWGQFSFSRQSEKRTAYKKNPAGLREYYFNEGVFEHVYKTEDAAWKAAQKLANQLGKAVRVRYRDLAGGRNVGRARYRGNPKARKRATVSQSMIAKAKAIIRYAENDLGKLTKGQRRDLLKDNTHWSNDAITDIVDRIPGAISSAEYRYSMGFDDNPAMLGRSVMATRWRGLPTAQEIQRLIFGTKAKVRAVQRKLSPAKAETITKDGPYMVYWTDARGEKSTDASNRKEADAIAKALKSIRLKGVRIA